MDGSTFTGPFRLPLVIEQVEDGTYLAINPALSGFLVQADTLEEVMSLAPGIAKTLIKAMREKGIYPDLEAETLQFPAVPQFVATNE